MMEFNQENSIESGMINGDGVNFTEEQLKKDITAYLRIEEQLESFAKEKERLAKEIENHITQVALPPVVVYRDRAWYLSSEGLAVDHYRELQ